jgi:hypothetical protein
MLLCLFDPTIVSFLRYMEGGRESSLLLIFFSGAGYGFGGSWSAPE